VAVIDRASSGYFLAVRLLRKWDDRTQRVLERYDRVRTFTSIIVIFLLVVVGLGMFISTGF
jgi:hypothetical protein